MINVGIFEDDPIQRTEIMDLTQNYLADSGVQLFEFSRPEEYLCQAARMRAPLDIALLDIEMGSALSGLALAKELRNALPHCQVIFISGYMNYVLDVYAVPHIYFIYKPQLTQRLPDALQTAVKNLADDENSILPVAIGGRHIVLRQVDIEFLERDNRIVRVHCISQTYRVTDSLTTLYDRLDKNFFVRCHNSFIVNIRAVREYKRTGFTLEFGGYVPIARSCAREVKEFFAHYMARRI